MKPVAIEHVNAIEPFVSRQVWGMIQLQLWSGCRPGESAVIRGCDINVTGDVWEYRPHVHKTEHHDIERVVYLGPHAQEVIKPWLRQKLDAYLFQPREARKAFVDSIRKNKPEPPVKQPAKRRPGVRYNMTSYGHAIAKACDRAGIPRWKPNQLRHTAATRIRQEYGIEMVRILLGHQSAVTSELYAEVDRAKAIEAIRKIG